MLSLMFLSAEVAIVVSVIIGLGYALDFFRARMFGSRN